MSSKPYSLHKGTPSRPSVFRGFAIGERVHVRTGLFAGHTGVIERLRADGRPIFRMSNGALVRCELAGEWVRPDVAPPPSQFYDRHLIPLGYGDKAVKVMPR